MKIENFFEKGYYINLDRRVDRKAQFEEEVKKVGLEGFFERFSGEDALPHLPKDVEKHQHLKNSYCSKSFYNLFEKIYNETNHETFLIVEDDIQFYDKGKQTALEIIEKSLDQLQQFDDWDMIFFGGYIFDNPVIKISENLLKPNITLTMHAIGYRRKILPKLLSYKPFTEGILDSWVGENRGFNKYFTYPLAVLQREGPSDIDMHGRAPGMSHWESHYNRLNIVEKFNA
jgi:GR25 family glycosyltransferase involved in LPS biosynthesis